MGFGKTWLDDMGERNKILSDLWMITDTVNLLEKIQKQNDERMATLKSITDELLEDVGNKITTILKGIKTHLSKWISIKVSNIDSNYINDYFKDQIKIFDEITWVNKSDEFNTVVDNLKELKQTDPFLENNIKSAINKCLNVIVNKIISKFKDYR